MADSAVAPVPHRGHRRSLHIGAACAVAGTAVFVPAGILFGRLPTHFGDLRSDMEVVAPSLEYLAARADWYWPVVQSGFIVGAGLWTVTLIVLVNSGRTSASPLLTLLATVGGMIGLTAYVAGAFVSGFVLAGLAHRWRSSAEIQQGDIAADGALAMQVLDGTWASMIVLFHGAVFILVGSALVAGRDYQPWLPWVGLVAGLASAGVGFGLFFGILVPGRGGEWGFIAVNSLQAVWILAAAVVMLRRATGGATR